MKKPEHPIEVKQLGEFLASFNKESDRGAALVAASMLDERLQEILAAFFIDSNTSRELLGGFNAPLGTFSSRTAASVALGLIEENEFKEITLIRKIRNEFGHGWESLTFESSSIAGLTGKLPWLGPTEYEAKSTLRARFNFAVAILLTDLMWRAQLVRTERRVMRKWPNKSRHE
jgi:DNA-binding MltR family transcriptional regulator